VEKVTEPLYSFMESHDIFGKPSADHDVGRSTGTLALFGRHRDFSFPKLGNQLWAFSAGLMQRRHEAYHTSYSA
jgi:hypothetical protein